MLVAPPAPVRQLAPAARPTPVRWAAVAWPGHMDTCSARSPRARPRRSVPRPHAAAARAAGGDDLHGRPQDQHPHERAGGEGDRVQHAVLLCGRAEGRLLPLRRAGAPAHCPSRGGPSRAWRPGAAASSRSTSSLHAAGAAPGQAWARRPSAEQASAPGGCDHDGQRAGACRSPLQLRREGLHTLGRRRVSIPLPIFTLEAMPSMGC